MRNEPMRVVYDAAAAPIGTGVATPRRGARTTMKIRCYLTAAALLLLVACGGEEPPAQTSQPAPPVADTAVAAGDSLSADSALALPPGLAPVAIDPEPVPAGPAGPSRSDPPPATPPADTPPPAQDDGAEVLRRAAAAYEGVRSMQADFVMRFNNPLLRQQTTSRGTLYQQRPDRIALRFTDPAGDIILSDGEYFYVYQPSIDPRQATQTPAAPGGGGGVDLQAQFVGNPTERFRWTVEGTENVGDRPARVLTLVPRDRAEYRSLKVWFDTRDSLARRFEITEHNGSVRRFDLSGLRTNSTIPADIFRFSAPADVRIVRVG